MNNGKVKEHKSAIGVIIFILILVVMSLIFTIAFAYENKQKTIELPRVNFSVVSKDGLASSNVSAVFSIKTDDKKLQTTDKDVINAAIVEAMTDIDYEALSEENGTDYVKAVVKEKLSRKYGSAIEEVYISDFINDVKIPSKESQDNKQDSNVNKAMEGLFKNMD